MTEELRTNIPAVKECETTSTKQIQAYVKKCNEQYHGFMNIKPLMLICEAVRRILPSKQKLTLSRIKRFILNEGFVPMQNGDDRISFNAQGEKYEIYFDGIRLGISKIYKLPEEGFSINAMLASCRKVTGETYGVKAMLGMDENACLLRFCSESVCRSYSEFSYQFYYYMGAINHCVSCQKEAYGTLLDQFPLENVEAKSPKRKIGFAREENDSTEQKADQT